METRASQERAYQQETANGRWDSIPLRVLWETRENSFQCCLQWEKELLSFE